MTNTDTLTAALPPCDHCEETFSSGERYLKIENPNVGSVTMYDERFYDFFYFHPRCILLFTAEDLLCLMNIDTEISTAV